LDPAILVDDLVDSLIDDLRDELHNNFGVRQFRMFTVLRTWDSGYIGDGSYTDTENEITPRPLVQPYRTDWFLEPAGLDEEGMLDLREISLSYTEAELTGGNVAPGCEWFILLRDGHGQEIEDQWFLISRRPFPDRIKDMGWSMRLRAVSSPSSEDVTC